MNKELSVTLDSNGLAEASGVITVYNFEPESGLFTGSSQEFLTQGVGIPANSASESPPDVLAGKARVFSGGRWQYVDDHRGETVYIMATGEPVQIIHPGNYPEGTTPLRPATAFDVWSGKAWKTDAAAQQAAALCAIMAEKSARIAEANRVTQAWQTQLLLGIITDVDRASLTRWMQYIQEVQATDESGAPNINWPVKPS